MELSQSSTTRQERRCITLPHATFYINNWTTWMTSPLLIPPSSPKGPATASTDR